MSIVQYTEQEQRLTNTLRLTTEALRAVTAERDALVAELGQPVPLSEWQQLVAERDALRADAERYDYLLTKRLGWLSNRAPLPWGKQTQKEAMSVAIDDAMKGTS